MIALTLSKKILKTFEPYQIYFTTSVKNLIKHEA